MRYQKRSKIRLATKIDAYIKQSKVKTIEIKFSIEEKIISNAILNSEKI